MGNILQRLIYNLSATAPLCFIFALLWYWQKKTMDIPCIYIDWIDFLSALSKSFPDNAVLFVFTNYGDKSIYEPIVQQCHERRVKIIWISSTDLDSSLLNTNDIYISTHETELESPPLLTKLTSFLLVQFIIEYLRHNIDKQEA